jgi:hypothetical protein
MKKIIILTLVLASIIGCQKEAVKTNPTKINTGKHKNTTSVVNSMQNYLGIVSLATIDLFKRSDIKEMLLTISAENSGLSDSSDFYVYLDQLILRYENTYSVDVVEIMEESIINNGGTMADVELFQEFLHTYVIDNFEFRIRYFLPYRNEYYTSMTLPNHPNFGVLLFSIDENYDFPGMEYSNNDYTVTTFNYDDMDTEPIVLISSSVYNTNTNEDIDIKMIEACGRCKPDNTIPSEFCAAKGHQCKCESPPISFINEFVSNLF